jgi:hypothetical protein
MQTDTMPLAKKQKLAPKIQKLDAFGLQDVCLQPIVKNAKCNLVPMLLEADKKSPVLVQLSGGGKIPLAFGLETKDDNGKPKTMVSLQIECLEDHAHLDRLRTETASRVVANWASWYPENKPPSAEVLQTLCNPFVSARKKKKNSEETWSGVTKATLDATECQNGQCRIVDAATGDTIPYTSIAGMRWTVAILELRYIYIQSTKSYGITKKLRYLACTPPDTAQVAVTTAPHVSLFGLQEVQFEPLVKSSKCQLVPMSSLSSGGPVLVRLDGGGRIPVSFGIEDKETEGRRKTTACVQIDSLVDHAHLERLQRELSARAIALWPTWFPDAKAPSDEVLQTLCNAMVSVRKPKKNSDETWSGCLKAIIEAGDLVTGACTIVDDVSGVAIPYDTLPGMHWTQLTLELRYVYIMSTKAYGITKKIRRMTVTPGEEYAAITPI